MSILCLLFLVLLLLFCMVIQKKAKEEYEEYIAPLEEKEYRVKKYLPIGLYIDEYYSVVKFLPKAMQGIWQQRKIEVQRKMNELYGEKAGEYYFTIFSAEKKVYMLLCFFFVFLFGLLLAAQGDIPSSRGMLLIGIPFSISLLVLLDTQLKTKLERRHTLLRLEFPDFVNKLVLLVNAGMTVPIAWERIVKDSGEKKTPLYEELRMTQSNIHNGMPPSQAIELFGRRCKVKEIMKFTTILVLNLQKGGGEMVPVLLQQAEECWEMRKSAAQELGVQAGAKMMLPLVGLLLTIVVVIGTPALMMMSGI